MADEWSLESPESSDDLYLGRGVEVADFVTRPAFTGDVFLLESGRIVALVQHPCAMRRGISLAPKLLACEVKVNDSGTPKDWSRGHFKKMFLPDLDGASYFIDFEEFDAFSRDELEKGTRMAILSSLGVNLLTQRWLYHNSRVIVPSITINAQTSGPFEEADLMQEACDDLMSAGRNFSDAVGAVDQWLGEAAGGRNSTNRDLLADPQQRSSVRVNLRRQVRVWASE